jgi:hypothetical protein
VRVRETDPPLTTRTKTLNAKTAPKFSSEKDVELHFKRLLERATGSLFETINGISTTSKSKWETDGLIEWTTPSQTTVRVLLEAKYNRDLANNPQTQLDVLGQCVYYLKRFEEKNITLPNVLFVADEVKCYALSTDKVLHFLNAQVDWTRAPSNPDPNLKIEGVLPLGDDTLSVSADYLKTLCENLAEGVLVKIRPSVHNLSAMFEFWDREVFPDGKYSPVERVHIFLQCLFYGEDSDSYVPPSSHPKRKKTHIVVEGTEIEANQTKMTQFFERRARGLSPKEIAVLERHRDRIIEDTARRRQGAFYTPTLWVDEAHLSLEALLGADWRNECIVWDPCAGTGNLTRDYSFSNLILSTAEAPDMEVLTKQTLKSKGAEVFQYDFLNPNAESPFFDDKNKNRLPLSTEEKLRKAASEGKRLVFLMNPPYAEDGVAGAKGDSKKDVADTLVSRQMPRLGRANRQLYAQFLFQAEQLAYQFGFTKKTIAVFSPTLFMVSGSFKGFRSYFYDRYAYQTGFMFQASHFADVKGSWGIGFTLWNEGKTDKTQDLPMTLKDKNLDIIVDVGVKDMYPSEGREASDWVSALAPKSSLIDTPKFSSGLSLKEVEGNNKGSAPNSLGIMCNMGNNIMKSGTDVFLLSGKPTHKGCCNHDMTDGEGWRRSIALYSARKLVDSTWATQKDEYLAPNTQAEGYEQWVDDCHIYALLHTSNNMTAMRDVEYKGKKWNIHNHFFWLTRQEAHDLYENTPNCPEPLVSDAENNPIPYESESGSIVDSATTPSWRLNGDPYFAHILPSLNLSPLAQEILNDLKTLHAESVTFRKTDDHMMAWDAGVYQHKRLWKGEATLEAKWEALNKKHKALASQLEHGVYTYGFLKK